MATITSLAALAKTSVGANDYLLTSNAVGPVNNKFLLQDLFPTVNTLGTTSESLFISITNKNALNFKGIRSLNNLLTVATASNNITLQVNEANINLANCNNTTSLFLSAVNLAAAYISGILPVANGGTGASSLVANSLLIGNGTSALSALGAAANGQIPIGRTGLSPILANLTAGANITITNGAGSITIAAALAAFTNNVNGAGYNLYGLNWISGDTGNRGIKVNTTGQTFIGSGSPTPFFTGDLNVANGIYVNGNIPQTIGAVLTSIAAPGSLTLKAADANAANVGGTLNLRGGNSQGSTVVGGDLNLFPGNHDGTGISGDVNIWGYTSGGIAQLAIKIKGESKFVGINNSSPIAPIDVRQSGTAANTPVARLEQLDTDESFVNFVGTSSAASANSISSSSASAGAKTGAIRVKINGVDAWIRVYATAE
jgi:hypothetical protein